METQPTQSDAFYDFLAWADKNKKQVITGLLAVAVVGAAIGLYVWNKNSKEASANDALFALPSGLMQARKAVPTGESYMKVADEYAGTGVAERAELIGAGFLFAEGKFDQARKAFEDFLTKYPESALKSQAAYGIAASLEAGNKPEALAKYQDVVQKFPGENVAPLANLARARLLETQGKPEEALKIYDELQGSKIPGDSFKTEAMDRREKLLAKNPQLAPKTQPDEQVIEVTTPPEGSTEAPKVRVVSPEEAATNSGAAKP